MPRLQQVGFPTSTKAWVAAISISVEDATRFVTEMFYQQLTLEELGFWAGDDVRTHLRKP